MTVMMLMVEVVLLLLLRLVILRRGKNQSVKFIQRAASERASRCDVGRCARDFHGAVE